MSVGFVNDARTASDAATALLAPQLFERRVPVTARPPHDFGMFQRMVSQAPSSNPSTDVHEWWLTWASRLLGLSGEGPAKSRPAARPTGVVDAAGTTTGVLWIKVTDSGIGMTPQQLERIARPFQQADNSTVRQYGGTGLGLSICHEIVDLLGGSLAYASAVGVGSIFTVALPVVTPRLSWINTDAMRDASAVESPSPSTQADVFQTPLPDHLRVARSSSVDAGAPPAPGFMVWGPLLQGHALRQAPNGSSSSLPSSPRLAPLSVSMPGLDGDLHTVRAGRSERKAERPLVMVVDDNPLNVQVLTAQLRTLGCDALPASSGEECLDKLAALGALGPRRNSPTELLQADGLLRPGQPIPLRDVRRRRSGGSTGKLSIPTGLDAPPWTPSSQPSTPPNISVAAIFLALHMPGMNGISVAAAIRDMERGSASSDRGGPSVVITSPRTPILALSGDTSFDREWRDAGVDAVLSKPLRVTDLEAALRHANVIK